MTNEKELMDDIAKMFEQHPEVSAFLKLHNTYVHAVDDLEDKAKDVNPLYVAELAMLYYNHPIYVKNREALYLVSYLNHNSYRDSVAWEKNNFDDGGMRLEAAKTLRHASIDMFFALVLLYCGPLELARISPRLRAYTLEKHRDDIEFAPKI